MLRAVCTIALVLASSCGRAADAKPPPVPPAPSSGDAKPAPVPPAPSGDARPAPGQAKQPVPAAAGVKTIIVIRHAEAVPSERGGDPVLTADGKARAIELARTLTDTPLRTVYTTHYHRGRMTAEPLPAHAGEKPIVIDDVTKTLDALRAEPWGATALVVGHSNTVPDLIRGLTGQALPTDEPIIFDRMWIVTLTRDGAASLLRLHYGAPVSVTKAP